MRFRIIISFLLIFSLNSFNLRQNSNTIELDLHYMDSRLLLPIGVGTKPQYFMLVLDTASFHMWLLNNTINNKMSKYFISELSSTFEETSNKILGTNQKGNQVLDFIQIKEGIQMQRKFSFLLLNSLQTQIGRFDGVIGMSRDFTGNFKYLCTKREINANPEFSIMQHLITNKIINNKVFGLRFVEHNIAKLYLGSNGNIKENYPTCVPNEKHKNYEFYHNWNCAYSGIALKNGTFIYSLNKKQKHSVTFETMYDYIKIFNKQADILFKFLNVILEKKCTKKKLSNKRTVLFCPKEVDINKVPDLIIKIEGFDFVIPSKEIFEQAYIDEKGGIFGYSTKIVGYPIGTTLLKIGLPFLKYYHLVFDYENGSVGFAEYIDIFSNENNNRGTFTPLKQFKRPWSNFEIFTILLIICVVFFIAYYIYLKRKIRKKKIIYTKEKLVNPIGNPMLNLK